MKPYPVIGLLCVVLSLVPGATLAWGPEGHKVVGAVALNYLTPESRHTLAEITGNARPDTLGALCYWPDVIRDDPDWPSKSPYHYVNLPRGAEQYQAGRDCPGGLCITEKLQHFAAQLADPSLDREQHWQALAWVCHLTGDLHQPLHTGYADDRGGNEFMLEFDGEPDSLHWTWDQRLIESERPAWRGYARQLTRHRMLPPETRQWRSEDVVAWTNESRGVMLTNPLYPDPPVIDQAYREMALPIIDRRLQLAGYRLAGLLNTVWNPTPAD